MDIRVLGPDDWEAYRDLRLRALADSPDAFAATLEGSRALDEAAWRARLAGPGPTYGASDEGGALVAMAGGFPLVEPDDTLFVWGMWTAPRARGRGFGRALLDTVVAWSRDRGRDRISLHVTEGNDGARRLYESIGFVATGEWEPLRDGSPLRIERLALPAR